MEVLLKIDYREHAIIEKFKNETIKKEVCPLEIADFHFLVNGELYLVIERKTEADLQSSIKDGRWREQKERLDILKNSHPSVKILFLIEQVETIKRSNLDFKILQGAILNTIFRDEYPVLFSECVENTLEYLDLLYKKIEKGEFEKSRGSYIETSSVSLKKKMNKDDFLKLTLCSIPRVSMNISTKICEKYSSLDKLIEDYKREGTGLLSEIQVTEKKKLGKKLSSDIFEYLI